MSTGWYVCCFTGFDDSVRTLRQHSPNMKILLITGSFPPMRCGVGDYTFQLARALARDPGLQVAVLTSTAAALLESPTNFAFFPVVRAWDWSELKSILGVIRKWKPDLVHVQYPTLGYGRKRLPWVLPLCLHLAGFPVVQTWHEIYQPPIRSAFIFWFLSKAVVPGGLVIVRKDYRIRTKALLRWVFLNKTVRFIPNASAIPAVELSDAEREAIRSQYARPGAHIIAYFGFIQPSRQVELLFQMVDSNESHLVIVGDSFREADLPDFPQSTRAAFSNYYQSIKQLAESEVWKGKVTMCGFMPALEAARVLATADAVVIPILGGAGEWNTSVHGAQAQGTFVLTTSMLRRGYDPGKNTYFAGEHDLEDMRWALKQYVGKRSAGTNAPVQAWESIRESHVALYRTRVSIKAEVLLERADQ